MHTIDTIDFSHQIRFKTRQKNSRCFVKLITLLFYNLNYHLRASDNLYDTAHNVVLAT